MPDLRRGEEARARCGVLVLLDDQDRSLWNREQIAEGSALVERALSSRRFGPYTFQAAIAAVHSQAPNGAATDWMQIVGLYDVLGARSIALSGRFFGEQSGIGSATAAWFAKH